MGEYWKPVNLTRREWINPHDHNDGLKWGEWTWSKSATMRLIGEKWSKTDEVIAVSDYGGLNGVAGYEHRSLSIPTYQDLDEDDSWTRITAGSPPADSADNAVANATMTEFEAFTKIVQDEDCELSGVGDVVEESGHTFTVVDVHRGADRRWSAWVEVTSKSETGRYWQYGFDRGLTENQDNTEPSDFREVERVETPIIKVTYKPAAHGSAEL